MGFVLATLSKEGCLSVRRVLLLDESEHVVSNFEDRPFPRHQLLDVVPDGIVVVDDHGVIRHVNEFVSVLTGYAHEELIGQAVEVLVPSPHREAHVAKRDEYARDPVTRMIRGSPYLTLLRRDGSEISVDIALSPLGLEGKPWVIALIREHSAQMVASLIRSEVSLKDLAGKLAGAVTLAETEERTRLAFENTMVPMTFTDLDGRAVAVNNAFCQMVGYTREELLGRDSIRVTHPEDVGISEEARRRIARDETEQARYVKRYLHKDGRVVIAEVSKSAARDVAGRTLYFVSSERDITEERALIVYQARHDPLTGLANRVLFEERLAEAYATVVRQGGLGAVLLVNLDNFSEVNDLFGHVVGDQMLVAVAHRLAQVTRTADTLCHLGGDEFLYLAVGLRSEAEAEKVSTRLLGVFAGPFTIAGGSLEQSASVGVVVWDGTSRDYVEFIQDADVALHEAKRQGKGRHVVSTSAMQQQASSRFALVRELRHALPDGQLAMHYQPIVDLTTTDVVGFEALMRWQNPERGLVPPDVFIPLAEESDLIFELGHFALREAVVAADSWDRAGAQATAPYVTVNLSMRQFHDPNLVSMIEEALTASGLAPQRLIVEITERVALLEVDESLGVISRLDLLGLAFALDDFGTGFSSLSYLALLHPRILKIDRSFVSPANENVRNDTMLEAIISLGHKLGMTLLAEGIETPAQLERLRNLGCELGQGYLFSAAVPADEVAAVIAGAPSA